MTNANNDVRELEDLLTELEGQGALPVGPYSDEDDAVTQLMDAPLGEQEWMVQITPHDRRMMSTDQLLAEIAAGNLVRRDTLVWRATMSDWAPIARVDELMAAAVDMPMAMVPERRPLPPPPAPIPPTRLPSSTMVSPGVLPPNGVAPTGGLAANGVGAAAPSPSASSTMSSSTMPSSTMSSSTMSSSTMSSNGVTSNPVPRTPLPPVPSAPYGASQLTPVPSTPYAASQLTPVPLTPVPDAPPPAPLPYLNSAFGSLGATPVPSASPPPEPPSTFNVPLPAPAPAPPTMRANTPRPVAVDFSEMEPVRTTPMKILVGSGVAALAMIVGTVYALSAGGVFDANAEVSHASAASRATTPSPEPAAAKPVEAKPAEAKPAEAKPAEAMAPDQKVAEAKPAAESGQSENQQPQTQPASAKEEMVAEPEPKGTSSKLSESRSSSKQTVEAEPKADAPASDDDAREANESPRGSRAERRMAARLRKRAATEAPGAAASRSKPRAAAAAATPSPAVEADESAKGPDTPGSTFNKQAAKTALDDAAAQARNCRPQGGPSGAGRVQVRYEPTGKVGEVSILTPQFDNTTTGSCVVMVFRRASIPAFTGSPAVVMNKNFEIP
jgi:hypothetical protein